MLRDGWVRQENFSVLIQAIRKLPVSLLLLDPYGHLLYINEAALSLLAIPKEELSPTTLQSISGTFSPDELSGIYKTLLHSNDQQVQLHSAILCRDGRRAICNLHFSLIREDNNHYLLVSIGQAGQEEPLQAFPEQLKQPEGNNTGVVATLLEQTLDGFVSFDTAWNYTYINRKAAALTGHSPNELIGRNLHEVLPGLFETSLHAAYEKAMKEQVVIRVQEYIPLFQKWLEIMAYPSPEGLSIFFQDMTDKKMAESALEEKEFMYQTIIETSQEGIWQIDAENRTTFVNNHLLSLLGYAKEEMLGKSFLEFIEPEAMPEAMAMVEERKKGIGRKHEFTFLRKDGSPAYTYLQSKPIIRNGSYAGAVAMVMDYTDRKKAEEKLVENEKRFRALFDYSQDGIALLTEEGMIIDLSTSIEKILGYSREELMNTSRLDFVHPDDIPLIYAAFDGTLPEPMKSLTTEYRAVKKDGTVRWLEGTFSNLLNEPAVKAVVLNFRDITERKQAENKLKESEARYRKAQTQGKLGHWEWDLSSDQLVWSNEIYNMFGLTPTAHHSGYNEFLSCIHPDDRPLIEKEISKAVRDGKNYQLNYRIVLDDGTIRYIYTVAEFIKDTSGNVTKAIGMVQDVTEQKLIEKELSLSEGNHRLLFEKSPVPFWMAAYPTFDFIEANQAATDLYGYTREEFLSMNVRHIRLENGESYFEHLNTTVKENETRKGIAKHKKKNGDLLFVHVTITRIAYNGKTVWLACTRDITQEKQYEMQLQDKEKQLSLIFNSTVNGMALFKVEPERHFRFEAVNDALCKAIQITREQALGQCLDDLFGFENIQHLLPGFQKAVVTGTIQSFTAESTQRAGNRIVEYTAIPIKDEGGNVAQLLSISHDVTENIKAEKDLLRINNELRLLSSHLESVREEERTKISREIHDELGQQLTGLKMEISWIKRHLQEQDKEIKTRIQSSLHLIDDTINSVRRIASQLRPSILDDLGLAEALLWQGSEFSSHTNIQVSFASNVEEKKFSPALSIAVFRIFQEALTNVARHAKATKVECSLKKEKDRLQLTVADNGIGFEWQPKSERKTLGLLGMEERATVLNGRFTVKSKPGEGTTILVIIPMGEESLSEK